MTEVRAALDPLGEFRWLRLALRWAVFEGNSVGYSNEMRDIRQRVDDAITALEAATPATGLDELRALVSVLVDLEYEPGVRRRILVLFCRHRWAVHLCQPPSGIPSLVICDKCGLVA